MKRNKSRIKGMLLFFLAITMILSSAVAPAATLTVPSTAHPTIQSAIDAAEVGDTVEVGDGTFSGDGNIDLDFKGKAITVKSKNGAENTTIDCQGNGRGVYFHTSEDNSSVFSGFTIINGSKTFGGGVYCYSASPTIENCIITANAATSAGGGGLDLTMSSPRIVNCVISGNTAVSGGGGINCHTSNPVIENCVISGNTANGGGGVNCATASSITITNSVVSGNTATNSRGGGVYGGEVAAVNCVFDGNYAGTEGGGVYAYNPDTSSFTNCVITNNTAGSSGGGVYCGAPTLVNCVIRDNTAASDGGGLYGYAPTLTGCTMENNQAASGNGGGAYFGGSPTLEACAISKNTASGNGGGLCFFSSFHAGSIARCVIHQNSATRGGGIYGNSSSITNSVISANTASQEGGGVYVMGHAAPGIMNATFSLNSAVSGGGIYCKDYGSPTIANSIFWADAPDEIFYMEHFSDIVVTYSDVQGSFSGAGNINADPLFVGDGNYHLTQNSPCIDAGASDGAPDEDLEETPRPLGAGPDMGAYEYGPGVFNGCLALGENNSIAIPCIDLNGDKLSFTFAYSRGLIFEVDVSTVAPGAEGFCMSFEDDLSIDVPCFYLDGASFNFTLYYMGDLDWEVRLDP
ncbi:MAG: hypothetical protein GY859_38550 [Desulfobacterales bacterium]|nr:hypothetical protein [Desulfobacterales bacterium]